MQEIGPDEPSERLRTGGADVLVLDVTPLADGQTIPVGGVAVAVVHTPGHSEGSVSFGLGGEALVTGDTLFHESVGRESVPGDELGDLDLGPNNCAAE